jgi:hypothetical protein
VRPLQCALRVRFAELSEVHARRWGRARARRPDGDELAPGGPLSRVQASDGLRHRRAAAKAIGACDAFEELGVPDEFEHSIGAEVVLEINGERPVVWAGSFVRS